MALSATTYTKDCPVGPLIIDLILGDSNTIQAISKRRLENVKSYKQWPMTKLGASGLTVLNHMCIQKEIDVAIKNTKG